MRNFLLPAIIGFIAFGHVSAAGLTPDEALARLNDSSVRRLPARNNDSGMKYHSTIGNLYIFTSGNGYMILPDDDRAPPLLGYSDSDTPFTVDNPELNYWLECYNREIDYIKACGNEENVSPLPAPKERAAIRPLLLTEWNQESPYNLLCPKVDGHETVTGCVATAMAQVMKYHNFPDRGKGTHSYYWEPGKTELTFDYDNTPFRWDLMTDRYDSKSTEESKEAVARLMLGCGISVDMHYEPGGSGAATTRMGEALIDIFGYSPSLWMPNRAFYGYEEWEDMIYADLALGLPVLYSGAGTAGGHQFVCDGYSADGYFHFNWGWGGLSNGYFLLTALNPDDLGVGGGAGGFNTSQVASLGVRPARSGDKPVYVMYNTKGFSTDAKEVKAGDDLVCSGEYFNYSLATLPDGSKLGMKISSTTGEDVRYIDGPGVSGLHLYDGRIDDRIKFPELPDGTYRITPALYADGKWSDVRMPVGYPSVVVAKVQNNIASLESQSVASISIKEISTPEIIYRDRQFPLPFTAENSGDTEFFSSVTPWLFDSDGKEIAKSKFRPLDVLPGTSVLINDYVADFSAIDGLYFPAGEYTLVFRDEEGKDVSTPIGVKVEIMTEETKISITDFKVDDKEPVEDPAAVRFSFTVKCESGIYYGAPRVLVFPGDGGYELAHKSSEELYLTPGERKEVEIVADFDHLEDGHYMALVYDGGEAMTGKVFFTIDRKNSGILTVTTSGENEKSPVIYGLDGIRRYEPLAPGVYIVDGKLVMRR